MGQEQMVDVAQIQIGNYIRMPVGWREHPFLLSTFMITKQEQIDIIKQMNLKFVYINLEKSEVPPKESFPDVFLHECEVIDNLLQEKMKTKEKQIEELSKYKNSQRRAAQDFSYSLEQIKSLMNKIRSHPLHAIQDATQLINFISNKLFHHNNITLHLISDLPNAETFYYHSLNVTTLSMLIAKLSGKTIQEINLLGIAALFHDIGNMSIPSAIFRKPSYLSNPELNIFKLHPIYSVKLLNLSSSLKDEVKEIIAAHHERLDGTGYPKGLMGSDISELTQLMSVADEYDYLCNPVLASKRPLTPYNALSFLYKHSISQLNKQYVQLLIKQLGIYPPGCIVELENGQIGLVVAINSQQLLHPSLMVYDPHVPKNSAAIIDLSKMEYSIKRVLLPTEITADIREYLQPARYVSYFFDATDDD